MSVDRLSENLRGKVAIVTGAASGIGLAIARLLNEYGVSVVAEDIDPGVDNLFGSSDTVASLVGDVAQEQTILEEARKALRGEPPIMLA